MKKLSIGILDFSGTQGKTLKKRAFNPIAVLRQKIKELGHIPKIYRAEDCQMFLESNKPQVFNKNKLVKPFHVLIPRVTLVSRLDLELPLLKQFQEMDIPVVNGYLPTLNAKNKLRTLQILTEHNIPVPKTMVVRKFEYLREAIREVGGYPVVLKAPFGTFGCGVIIVESARSLYSALDLILGKIDSDIVLLQEYIAESNGIDYRAFVIGDKVVAAMQRQAQPGDFRSNLELGGSASKAELTEEECELAVKATKALGLEISGVDILRTRKGPVIMEVNANPGFQGLVAATGFDIPGAMVEYAIQMVHETKPLEVL